MLSSLPGLGDVEQATLALGSHSVFHLQFCSSLSVDSSPSARACDGPGASVLPVLLG